MYLLKYPTGSLIKPHLDTLAPSLRHYRLNVVIWKAKNGGEFVCKDPIFETDRIKFFRPDKSLHSVKKIREGTRYVLSIGWALKEKHAS